MAIGVGPLAGFNIDPRSNQADRRAAVLSLNQGALCFIEVDGISGERAQGAELN